MNPEPRTSVEQHRAEAPKNVVCAVITVSDTRTEADDRSGGYILDSLKGAGHEVALYRIVKDEPAQIKQAVAEAVEKGVRVVLISGGTGITSRDQTYETVSSLIEKRMDGFGEIFRVLSYEDIGPAAMLSRAVAGTHRNMLLFSMPGSTGAVKLAMEKLLLPELGHVVRELNK